MRPVRKASSVTGGSPKVRSSAGSSRASTSCTTKDNQSLLKPQMTSLQPRLLKLFAYVTGAPISLREISKFSKEPLELACHRFVVAAGLFESEWICKMHKKKITQHARKGAKCLLLTKGYQKNFYAKNA